MAKSKVLPPARAPATAAAAGAGWPALIVVALLGAGLGAAVTYLALAPRLTVPVTNFAGAASAAPTSIPPAPINPAPELTAGQPPAVADRTLGNFYYDRSDWAQAAQHYESAIRQGSDDADIRTDLGNAYRFSNRRDDALAQYRAAQRLNPQHEFSLFNQGGLFFDQFNDPAKAIEIWNEYLRRFPQGSNVAAARQLITQAQAGRPVAVQPQAASAAPLTAVPPAGSTTDPVEARLLQLVKPKP
jgi:tetratricopeptide (TPR) repeat protein